MKLTREQIDALPTAQRFEYIATLGPDEISMLYQGVPASYLKTPEISLEPKLAGSGLKLACFFIPLIGIIIFAINHDKPIFREYSKSCLTYSIYGAIIAGIAIGIINLSS